MKAPKKTAVHEHLQHAVHHMHQAMQAAMKPEHKHKAPPAHRERKGHKDHRKG